MNDFKFLHPYTVPSGDKIQKQNTNYRFEGMRPQFRFSDYKSVNKRLYVGISSASRRVDRAR